VRRLHDFRKDKAVSILHRWVKTMALAFGTALFIGVVLSLPGVSPSHAAMPSIKTKIEMTISCFIGKFFGNDIIFARTPSTRFSICQQIDSRSIQR
jgi:hypothetical protein